ncbi:Scr1 family TA system antitoxin-like transcriptional regulator [Streptomyces sp. NPDC047917]|uniref:Scr1 family TA system antitoxin-like transcriptional regulator n=1 Tax=Streptomyces sp. NPDC047917 TaxID=3365491 RepID=UPI00371033D8
MAGEAVRVVHGGSPPFVADCDECLTRCRTEPDAPPLAYTEGQYHGVAVDDPSLVKQYRRSYDLLMATALPPENSLAMIEKAAEEYRNGIHVTGLEYCDRVQEQSRLRRQLPRSRRRTP